MSQVRRLIMASGSSISSNPMSFKHGLSLWCPQSSPSLHRTLQSSPSSSIGFKTFFRNHVVAASSSSFANENREYVIVGGGNAAGYAARSFVEHGMADGRLCIVTREAYAPYERPALTKGYLFPLDKKPARLPGFHTCVGSGGERQTPDWYKEQGIEMLYEDPVTGIDIEKQTATTISGKLLKYGTLIVATGCTASRFPEKIGGNLPGVHYIRDVADADSLISSLERAHKLVIVGGGYIGMEVAAAAVAWKLDTTIIFPENHLMQRLFTPSLAKKYEELYQENGVKFIKGASIKNLEASSDGHVAAVKLENGSTIEADTVIIGIGAKPAVGPFERLGLNNSVGGIQVDGQFRTGIPGIFAVGDVAAFPLKMYNRMARVEHVDHARRSAQHCVKSLLTAHTSSYDYLPYFYSSSRSLTMDTLLHTPTSMAKRPCSFPSSPSPSPNPNMNNQLDNLLRAFLNLADSPSLSIDHSFEHLLESSPCDADKSLLIDRALKLGSFLLEAGKRSARKRSSVHNSLTWALPPDLTIKVLSMLDTQSLCYAAATCSMFYKCAMDPLCYANIDLTTVVPKVNNAVVSTMIQRAGKALLSLKLGIVPGPIMSRGSCQPMVYGIQNAVEVSNFSWNDKKTRQGKESSILSRSCLNPLSGDSGAAGAVLRGLHLYNIERIDNTSLCGALSACPSLLDLEIIGLHVELRQTLVSVSMNCPLIERLFFESSKTGRDDSLKSPTCVELVNNCPNLTSLALRGFKLYDYKLRILVKGFRKLKYVDFSTSYSITGSFLRNLGGNIGGSLLEVMILRDCIHLKELEVARLLTSVLAGDFKYLQHLDISNREGLAAAGDSYGRCYSSSIIPMKQVLEERPEICLLAEFPSEGSFIDISQMSDSDLNSEVSLSSLLSSIASDGSSFMYTSESNYSSDQTSGNEDGRDSGYVVCEESSDEYDYLLG